ncbi:siderophore-interacting protein [Schumannella sp. 10F1B-5-1]|uniref:siderophore-interacting protein n=1 Tax=Schumannella sp. 10F1B-5-1 TaxID=2590780 RepID=UPI00351A7CDA
MASISNIEITHGVAGLVRAEVVRSERISPHFQRVTVTGPDLERWTYQGFDQWFRLAIPVDESHPGFDRLPDRIDMKGYLKYLTMPKATRPVIRNYTVRAYRPEAQELDIDFVVHGTDGVAGPWAEVATPGKQIAFIDQGCGWSPVDDADWFLLVADPSGLPAVAGILRDLPRDARGLAIVELDSLDDAQHVDAPDGVDLHWVIRPEGRKVGELALEHVRDLPFPEGVPYAFAVGEAALATGTRRYLVSELGISKKNVTFCGYWKAGRNSD